MELLTRLPLRRRIMVLVTAGLGFAFLLIGAAGLQIIRQSTSRILEERRVMAEVAAATLDERLAASLQRLQGLAATFRLSSVRPLPADMLTVLRRSAERRGLFSAGFFVADLQGRLAWPDLWNGRSLDDQALAGALAGRLSISGLEQGPGGEPIVTMWVPLQDAAGRTIGALGGAISLRSDTLVDLIQPLAFGRTGHAVIVDAQGFVLAGTDPEEVFTRGDHPDFFGNLIRAQRAAVGRTPEVVDGIATEDHIMAFAPLRTGHWGLGFGQADWDVFFHERQLGRTLALLGVILLTVGLLAAWWDAGVIATPLGRITASARMIAEGDLRSAIRAESGFETGLLAATLETMRTNLERARIELESHAVALARQEAQTSALYDVSRAILSNAHLNEVLATIASSARSLLGAEVSSVCLWDADGRRVIPGAFDGPHDAFPGDGTAVACAPVAAGADGRPVLTCPFVRPEYRRLQLTTDVQAGDRLIGFMCVGASRAGSFREDDAQLLRALSSLAAVAIESAQLRERVQQLAVLEDRERIARDLHDSIIQSLYGISLGLEHAQHLVAAGPEEAVERLETSITGVTDVIQGIRSYVMGLRPGNGTEGLAAAVEHVVRDVRVNTLLPIHYSTLDSVPEVSADERLHLQMILREALANVLRHADARQVYVALGGEEGVLRLVVTDDGRGFDPSSAMQGRGLGLRTMAERARRIGGELSVHSTPGAGTRLEIRMPVNSKELRHAATH